MLTNANHFISSKMSETAVVDEKREGTIIKPIINEEAAFDGETSTTHAPTGDSTERNDKVLLDDNGNPLSKNQLKKRRRHEKMMDQKKRRKIQDKEIKHAKALAEGRDLEQERRELEERTAKGDGHVRRKEFWLNKLKRAGDSFEVCIDCSFESQMSRKEVHSLALQLRYCYASNKRTKQPIRISLASLSGETRAVLDKVCGFPEQWEARAFSHSEQPLGEIFPERKDNLIYLTSDSEHTLEKLEDGKIYVIGGIVDRNRLKRAAIDRAEALGIKTAKLPITDHLELFTTKVLACNHVFDIILKVKENGNDWKQAMLDVLPLRKEAKSKSDVTTESVSEDEPTST